MKLQRFATWLSGVTFSSTALLLVLSSAHVQAIQQGASCSNKTIEGNYGFQDIGTRKSQSDVVSYTAVRTANFDGNGKHVGKGFLAVDGQVVGYTVTGTYTVNSDCTFTMDATQSYADGRPSQPYKQFGVVVRGGKEVLELQTTDAKNQGGKYQRLDNY